MKPIVPRDAAERDADTAVDYYTDEAGGDVARAFTEALEMAYGAIGDHPGTGSPRYAHQLKMLRLRSRLLHRFPFIVFYREHEEWIEVLRVLHAQRDIPARLREMER